MHPERQPESEPKIPEDQIISVDTLNTGAKYPDYTSTDKNLGGYANENIMNELPELIPDDVRYFGSDDETTAERLEIMKIHKERGQAICDGHPGMKPYIRTERGLTPCQLYFIDNNDFAVMGGHTHELIWLPMKKAA